MPTLREFGKALLIALAGAVAGYVGFAVFFATVVHAAESCQRYRADLTREAQAVFGLKAPVPALAGQLFQESTCRPHITAWDNGRGLAQFMDGTSEHVARLYPELGRPDPYNPTWSIRAFVRYDNWLNDRVQGTTACERWGASLKAYNAGLGYVQRAQRQSQAPGTWFGTTEYINAGQSVKNFEYSRRYPRLILFTHQLRFVRWGQTLCLETVQ